MRKTLYALFVVFLLTPFLTAQPQHYNYTTGSGNTFPLGQTAGKFVNWLFPAGAFNMPTPCPTGQRITKVYIRMYNAGTRAYTNLHILMAQTTLTNLTMGQFYPGPWDTVYAKDTSLTSTGANTWLPIQLQTPYPYDPTKSLVVAIGQCGGAGSGMYVLQTSISGVKRTWSVGGCPFTPYTGGDAYNLDMGIDVAPAVLYAVPELIYYRFENNVSGPLRTPNTASSPVGNALAPVLGSHTITSGGQFDSCLSGSGGSCASNYVNTGWNCNLGSGDWTIGFWVKNLIDLNPTYLWGDAGSNSFRCFYGGAALANNLLLRGPLTDILISCPMPGQHYFHFVYNGTNVLIYRDGTLLSTNPRTINMSAGSGFKVGAYSTGSFAMSGLMDEFRVYNRALTAAEVSATWNRELPIPVGTKNTNTQVPSDYSLSQNYPNPFNPVTNISYSIPKTGKVKLVIFDVLGREVATLVNEVKTPGSYSVNFDATNLASGVYMYRIESGDFIATKKMMLVK